jgi:hypothetical protein
MNAETKNTQSPNAVLFVSISPLSIYHNEMPHVRISRHDLTSPPSPSSCNSHAVGHLLTRSSLTHPEISSTVFPGSFCLLVRSFSLSCANCHEANYLHAVSNFSYSPVFCPKLRLHLIPLQSLYLFYDLSSL